jgi:hypothetical protein
VIFSPDFTADCLLALPLIVGVEVVIAAPDMEIIQLRWRRYPDTPQERKVYFRTVYPMEKLAQKILSRKWTLTLLFQLFVEKYSIVL